MISKYNFWSFLYVFPYPPISGFVTRTPHMHCTVSLHAEGMHCTVSLLSACTARYHCWIHALHGISAECMHCSRKMIYGFRSRSCQQEDALQAQVPFLPVARCTPVSGVAPASSKMYSDFRRRSCQQEDALHAQVPFLPAARRTTGSGAARVVQ